MHDFTQDQKHVDLAEARLSEMQANDSHACETMSILDRTYSQGVAALELVVYGGTEGNVGPEREPLADVLADAPIRVMSVKDHSMVTRRRSRGSCKPRWLQILLI